jgi:hypothetical protein
MAHDKSVSHSGNFQSDAENVGTGGDVEPHAVNVAPATLLTRSGTLIVRMCLPPGQMIQTPPGPAITSCNLSRPGGAPGLASSRDAVNAVNLQLLLRVVITPGGQAVGRIGKVQ